MKKQAGFTLLEMVIAISILAIMLSAVVFLYDGSKSRAQVLVTAMEEYASALERIKTDTSCYPKSLVGLFDRAQAQGTAKSFCGADLSRQWNGPYVKPVSTRAQSSVAGADGDLILLGQLSPDLTLRVARAQGTYSGSTVQTWKWFIIADGVPQEIVTQAVIICNGTDDSINAANAGATTFRKCSDGDASKAGYGLPTGVTNATADGTLGTVTLLFAETRR